MKPAQRLLVLMDLNNADDDSIGQPCGYRITDREHERDNRLSNGSYCEDDDSPNKDKHSSWKQRPSLQSLSEKISSSTNGGNNLSFSDTRNSLDNSFGFFGTPYRPSSSLTFVSESTTRIPAALKEASPDYSCKVKLPQEASTAVSYYRCHLLDDLAEVRPGKVRE